MGLLELIAAVCVLVWLVNIYLALRIGHYLIHLVVWVVRKNGMD